MTTPTAPPQPLNGLEIKRGIAQRMTWELPAEIAEPLQVKILAGLDKTCSLLSSCAYAKFRADWTMQWWKEDGVPRATWWVRYNLDDFGRVTSGGIGERIENIPENARSCSGIIDEVPPDRFRRETNQPIPKAVEARPHEPDRASFSKSVRSAGNRRNV